MFHSPNNWAKTSHGANVLRLYFFKEKRLINIEFSSYLKERDHVNELFIVYFQHKELIWLDLKSSTKYVLNSKLQ